MMLQIFDVEHGACSLLTGDNYARLMIDCGHNATTGWKPGTFLKQSGISELDMLAVTNYDEDHVSGARDLFDNINIKWIWRNASVSTQNIRSLKSEAGMGAGMDRLISEIDSKFSGGATTNGPPIFSGAHSS